MLNNRLRPGLLYVLIAISLLSFISIYQIESNASIALSEISKSNSDRLTKRRLLAKMVSSARERTIILLQMLNEKDVFIRDEMALKMSGQAAVMNQVIAAFKDIESTDLQQKRLSHALDKMRETAPKVINASQLMISEEDEKAKILLAEHILPSQKQIFKNLQQLENSLDSKEKDDEDMLNQTLISAKKYSYIMILILMGSLFTITYLIRQSSKSREKLLERSQFELKSSNQRLKQRDIELNALLKSTSLTLDTAPDAILSLDENSIIQRVNKAALGLLNYDKSSLIGAKMTILNIKRLIDGVESLLSETEILACYKKSEVTLEDKMGGIISVEIIVVDTGNKGTKIYTCMIHDLTEIKKTQYQLTESARLADAANIAKTQFLATMSHEIRTPMNGVIGMAELLKTTLLTEEQELFVKTINNSGQGLLAIINDILDFSKLDSGMTSLELIHFDLEHLTLECLEVISVNIKDKPIKVIFEYAPKCPRYFKGDPSRIRQILLNLLSNAQKFTHQGYIQLSVNMTNLSEQNNCVDIKIKDTGIGIKKDSILHLFDEFTQADSSTTRKYGGTGLGLAITKKLSVLMGGNVTVNSVYHSGSEFNVTLPLEVINQSTVRLKGDLKNKRILFIDAYEKNRAHFENIFNHMGLRTTTLAEPSQAIKCLADARDNNDAYDIAVLDHSLPDMNGLELGINIRNHHQLDSLVLMAFTTVGLKGDANEFKKAGFQVYLNKLCRYEILQNILSLALTHKHDGSLITRYTLDGNTENLSSEKSQFMGSILVVDDVATNHLVARLILEDLGLNVTVAQNGQEAIDIYQTLNFDMIFMDCKMPVLDGYQATESIRKLESLHAEKPIIPIVALTANTSEEDKLKCKESGMNDVLTKPFVREDIIKSLKYWLPKALVVNEEKPLLIEPINKQNMTIETLDRSVLTILKNEMGAYYQEMFDTCLTDIESGIESLNQKNKKPSELELIAHSIKSPSAYIGAMKINAISISIETNLSNGKDAVIDAHIIDLITSLNSELTKLKEALHQL